MTIQTVNFEGYEMPFKDAYKIIESDNEAMVNEIGNLFAAIELNQKGKTEEQERAMNEGDSIRSAYIGGQISALDWVFDLLVETGGNVGEARAEVMEKLGYHEDEEEEE